MELLAPAGNLEKLKYALIYGADAVYIGGNYFSLRARANNFSIDDIKKGCSFAHKLNKKVYVTANIIPHHSDLENVSKYFKELEKAKVDAVIISSPYLIDVCLKNTNLKVHLSTQQSAINSSDLKYWKTKGVSKIVLARELSVNDINKLSIDIPLEIFIHGGMCMSYSGRCAMSNVLTKRDANRGGCAHSCRWKYKLYKNNKKVSDYLFSLSSKDLLGINDLNKLKNKNIETLKIEGRMKSLHYITTVTKTYRMLIDKINKNKKIDYNYFYDHLQKAENRELANGYFDGKTNHTKQIFNYESEIPNKTFVGLFLSYDKKNNLYNVEQRNNFGVGDILEVFMPNNKSKVFKLEKLYDKDLKLIKRAPHAQQLVKLHIPFDVEPYSILRKA